MRRNYSEKKKGNTENVRKAIGQGLETEKRGQGHGIKVASIDRGQETEQTKEGQGHMRSYQVSTGPVHDPEIERSTKNDQGV